MKVIKAEELQGLKQQLEDQHRQELEKKYAKRYHHVCMAREDSCSVGVCILYRDPCTHQCAAMSHFIITFSSSNSSHVLHCHPQVRFFERVKIERSLAKLEKQAKLHAEGGGPFSDEERGKLAQLKDDLQVNKWREVFENLNPQTDTPS